jgi:hypothetical protein
VSDRPFDFETDADTPKSPSGQAGPGPDAGKESDGLLDMLRSRRGQRLGVDEDADDALALLLTHGVPAAHPRPSEVAAEPESAEPETQEDQRDAPAAQGDSFIRRRDTRPSMLSRLSLLPPHRDNHDDALRLHDGVSTDTREITIAASPAKPSGATPGSGAGGSGAGLDELLGSNPRRPAKQDDASPTTGQLPETEAPERPARPKRSSVPSWDEIVFGTRSD